MYIGNHAAPHRRNSVRKPLIILISVLLIAALTVGGTLAYLSQESKEPVKNTFEAGSVPIIPDEKFENSIKSKIAIKNTGSVPALVRAALVITPIDEEGNIDMSRANELSITVADTWTPGDDGYYYCNSIVAPGESTPDMLGGAEVDISGYQVDVLAQSVQAAGSFNGKSPSELAWRMTFTGSGWAVYQGA